MAPSFDYTVSSLLCAEDNDSSFSISQIEEVKASLVSQFDAVGKDVPDFEYTSQSISHLHNLATLSQANTQAALIVANKFSFLNL
ncbi:hypothetical protein CsSME_00000821 [Camellia sinensis var. sinensis]